MSYSFTVTGADKIAVKNLAEAEFVTIVAAQPNHAKDKPKAMEAIRHYADLLTDDPTKQISCVVSGSIAVDGSGKITAAGVSVSVSMV